MNKKLLIFIAAIVIVVIVQILRPKQGKEHIWVDNKIYASFTENEINETATEPTNQLIYIDVTGSMTPYYVRDKRTSMNNALSSVLTLIPRDSTRVRFLGGNEVHTGFSSDILDKAYSRMGIQDPISQISSVTNFDKMFKMAADSVSETSGMIVYLITDGIQSLNKKNRSMAYYLNELRASIKDSLSGDNVKDNVACGIYRYFGDFNGTYTNCREEKVNNQHLQRPFYIIAVGGKNEIRWLANHNDGDLGLPVAKLLIGIHDFEGHKKANLSEPSDRRLAQTGKDVTLILNLPPCMKNDVKESKCRVTGVSNPDIVGKTIKDGTLEIHLPPECGMHTDTSGFVSIDVSMPNEIPNQWTGEWSNTDDTSGPDSTTTFGLAHLIMGIVDGLQPDSLYFKTTFKFRP